MIRWVRAYASALPRVFLFLVTDQFARFRATRIAEALCRLGLRWFPEMFQTELAFIRCYAGDLQGGLQLLDDALPGERHAFDRLRNKGLMYLHHKDRKRAAIMIERAFSIPDAQRIDQTTRKRLKKMVGV
jgi:hypothetical protein